MSSVCGGPQHHIVHWQLRMSVAVVWIGGTRLSNATHLRVFETEVRRLRPTSVVIQLACNGVDCRSMDEHSCRVLMVRLILVCTSWRLLFARAGGGVPASAQDQHPTRAFGSLQSMGDCRQSDIEVGISQGTLHLVLEAQWVETCRVSSYETWSGRTDDQD